jgi:hypothetical protein
VTSQGAAIGLRAHSGWAAMVAITGSLNSPSVLDRRIIQLHNPKTIGSKQPYHAAEPFPLKDAEKFVGRCIEETDALAYDGLRGALNDLQKEGHSVVGCGILLGSGRTLPTLEHVLASHALIHTAEGELYRNALIQAAGKCKLAVAAVKQSEAFSRAAEILGHSEDELHGYLSAIGRSLGPPWREDQKHASLAAWIALATSSKAAGTR